MSLRGGRPLWLAGQKESPEDAVRGALVKLVGERGDNGRADETGGKHEERAEKRRPEQFHRKNPGHRNEERVKEIRRIAGITERREQG